MHEQQFEACTALLKSELKVAMGCTEPIAIAYCAAYARKTLGQMPQRCELWLSANVFKNVNVVTVPNTGGKKGVAVAALAGVLSGKPELELEVLSVLGEADLPQLESMIANVVVKVQQLKSTHGLHIIVRLLAGDENVRVEIVDSHTGVCRVEKNGTVLLEKTSVSAVQTDGIRRELSVHSILAYAKKVNLDSVREVLNRQIVYNTAIADEGLHNSWGCRVGAIVNDTIQCNDRAALKAAAAAGSDARMNGCPLPVVINSGSGNQGLTASVPVIQFARQHQISEELLLRALCISNLVAIHQKTFIGALSAYCGAVCAATGSAAAIAWLEGADDMCIAHTIINSIATSGGMICDGAKSSCAAKISLAVDGALTAYDMARQGMVYPVGDGVVTGDVEQTIRNMGRIAAEGMAGTDDVIVDTMLHSALAQ